MISPGRYFPGLGCWPPRCQSALCSPGPLLSPASTSPPFLRAALSTHPTHAFFQSLWVSSFQSQFRVLLGHPHLLRSLLSLISLSYSELGFIKLHSPPGLRWWRDSRVAPRILISWCLLACWDALLQNVGGTCDLV